MRGIVKVEMLDESHLHWVADVGGVTEEWDVEVTENVPNASIVWHSTSGAKNSGRVQFEKMAPERTRVTLTIDYTPSGIVENVGDMLGIVRRRIEGDLEAFKRSLDLE